MKKFILGLAFCSLSIAFLMGATDTGVDVFGSKNAYVDWSSAQGLKTIVTPSSGKKIVIQSWSFSTDVANNVYLLDGSTKLTGTKYFGATSGNDWKPARMTLSVDQPLKAWTSASANASVDVQYYED